MNRNQNDVFCNKRCPACFALNLTYLIKTRMGPNEPRELHWSFQTFPREK